MPVIILADVSGSMSVNGKIETLNDSVEEMLAAFVEEDGGQAEIQVAVITFGQGGARVYQPLTSASKTVWQGMKAAGKTPMGQAFQLARGVLEDAQQIPSRAYRAAVILVSDGQPTDEWEGPLTELLDSPRASKSYRFALAIGADADHTVLRRFLSDSENRVREAHEARQIKQFFRYVTMSVSSRSRSFSPDTYVEEEPIDLSQLDF